MSDNPAGRLIRDINPEDRPREKAMRYGFGALSNAELLALILRTGTIQCSITNICRQLFDSVENSFASLMRKTHKELTLIQGIGDVKAQQILAIMELVRRFSDEQVNARPNLIKTSRDIYDILKYEIGNKNHEEIWMLSLNRRNKIIGRHAITSGSGTASVFDPKMLLKKAILDEAESIVMAHNHPSGNLRPSPQDDAITRTMKNAAATMNLRLLDHLIVTTGGYYSYADEGKL